MSHASRGLASLRRLGAIGDIHAEHVWLEQAIEVLERRGVDRIVATGDIADGIGSVDRCCELLATHDVIAVGGNHDRCFLADTMRHLPNATPLATVSESTRAFLAGLPKMVELPTVSGVALLCHGIGENDMARVKPDDFGYALETNDDLQELIRERRFRWVINGHSHRRMVRAFPGVSIINAGTLLRDHSPCFLDIDFVARKVAVFEFSADGSLGEVPSMLLE
jgi:predicted phosphodiesterase